MQLSLQMCQRDADLNALRPYPNRTRSAPSQGGRRGPPGRRPGQQSGGVGEPERGEAQASPWYYQVHLHLRRGSPGAGPGWAALLHC